MNKEKFWAAVEWLLIFGTAVLVVQVLLGFFLAGCIAIREMYQYLQF